MEELITLPFRYFWVIQIIAAIANARNIWVSAQDNIRENPDLAPGYRMLANRYAFWTSVPPAVMGFGILQGGIPHMFYFFRPSDNDPYVLAYWLTLFLVHGVIETIWPYDVGGIATQEKEKHPSSLNKEVALNTPRFKVNRLLPGVYILVAFAVLYYFIRVPIEDLPIISK